MNVIVKKKGLGHKPKAKAYAPTKLIVKGYAPNKSKAKAFKGAPERPVTSSAPFESKNVHSSRRTKSDEFEEYLIYKKLKEEVSEFYSYPGLWLETPHTMLGGQTPLQLALANTTGKEVVLNLIQMIKTGMFT